MNTIELQKIMLERNLKIADLAKAINKSYQSAYSKLNGVTSITLYEAEKWQALLGIPDEHFVFYFVES